MKTILVVDDNAAFRVQVRAMLEAEGFDVLGEAGDGGTAIELARSLRPDVILLDIGLPDIDGFAVAERVRGGDGSRANPAIVFTSSREAATYRGRLRNSGASGFIGKDELSGAAINTLLEGDSI